MINFELCATCANYISNDEIEEMPIEHETAMFSGYALLNSAHGLLSMAEIVEGENSFRCECCKVRAFGEKFIFAGS